MSVLIKDQVFPAPPKAISDKELALIVATALRRDFGDSTSAIKQIGKVTQAELRAIKNWYEARNTPSSGHLLLLARSSESIFKFVLRQIGGEVLVDAFHLLSAKAKANSVPEPANQDDIYSIENCTINITLPTRIAQGLNQRQLWFLSELRRRRRVKADDIVAQWGASSVSAKNDIAQMSRMKLICFQGAKKTGHYSLI